MSYRERRAEEKRAQLLKEEEAKSKKIESEANLISDNQEIQSDKIGEFAERILLASSFQFPQRNELFTPGRMAFLFSLDIHDKYQLPDPYTMKNVSSVLRSAKDTKNLIIHGEGHLSVEHNLLRASSLLHSVLHKKQDSKTIEKEKPTQKTSKVLTQIDKQPTTQQVDDDDDDMFAGADNEPPSIITKVVPPKFKINDVSSYFGVLESIEPTPQVNKKEELKQWLKKAGSISKDKKKDKESKDKESTPKESNNLQTHENNESAIPFPKPVIKIGNETKGLHPLLLKDQISNVVKSVVQIGKETPMHPLLKNSNSNAKNTETSVLGSIEIPDSLDDDQRNMIDYNSNLRNYAFDQDVELDDEDEVEEAEDNLEDFKKLVDEMGTESISDLKRQNFHKKGKDMKKKHGPLNTKQKFNLDYKEITSIMKRKYGTELAEEPSKKKK